MFYFIHSRGFNVLLRIFAASVSIPHVSDVDAKIHDYVIPRRTMIQANLYSSHMDPRYWDQPRLFRPDRFIQGGRIQKNDALIPFSIGNYNN